MSTTKLVSAVEDYLTDLRKIRASGGGTGERSYYPPLTNLLNAVGSTLKPKVFCISEMAQQGAGHPDIGLYAAKQVQKGKPCQGQIPECGVLEVKSADDDAWLTVGSDQVSKYWSKYRLVLVTNTRDFVLLGEDSAGQPTKLETFRIAESVTDFESRLQALVPSRTMSALPWVSTSPGRFRIGQRSLSPRTWPSCSHLMRGTVWGEWRQLVMHPPSTSCARH